MYLGDLSAAGAVGSTLTIPRPVITNFGPRTLDDVGRNRTIWFVGNYFGEQQCQSTHQDAVQLLGYPTGARITVGEFDSPCTVLEQNNTYVLCKLANPVAETRDKKYTGGGLAPIRRSSEQSISFWVGKYLRALNPVPAADTKASPTTLKLQ